MAYNIIVSATNYLVTATSIAATVTVTAPATPSFAITTTNQIVNLSTYMTTTSIYMNAVELKVDDFDNYYKGDWQSGNTYYRGDIVNYAYSLYTCSTGTLTTLVSVIPPPQDLGNQSPFDSVGNGQNGMWRRVVWNEAPRDHLTITNYLNVGTTANITGNTNVGGNLLVSGTSHLVGNVVMDTPLDHLTVTNQISAGSIVVGGLTGNGLVINTTSTFNGTATFNGPAVFRNDVDMHQADLYLNNLHLTGYIVNTTTYGTFLIYTTSTVGNIPSKIELNQGQRTRFGLNNGNFAINNNQLFPWEQGNNSQSAIQVANDLKLQSNTFVIKSNNHAVDTSNNPISDYAMSISYNGADLSLLNYFANAAPTTDPAINIINTNPNGGLINNGPNALNPGPYQRYASAEGTNYLTFNRDNTDQGHGGIKLGSYTSIENKIWDRFQTNNPTNSINYYTSDAGYYYIDTTAYWNPNSLSRQAIPWSQTVKVSPNGGLELTADYFYNFGGSVAYGPSIGSVGGITLNSPSIKIQAPHGVRPKDIYGKEQQAANYGIFLDSTVTSVTGLLQLGGPLKFPDGSIQRTASTGTTGGTAFDFGTITVPATFTLDLGHFV